MSTTATSHADTSASSNGPLPASPALDSENTVVDLFSRFAKFYRAENVAQDGINSTSEEISTCDMQLQKLSGFDIDSYVTSKRQERANFEKQRAENESDLKAAKSEIANVFSEGAAIIGRFSSGQAFLNNAVLQQQRTNDALRQDIVTVQENLKKATEDIEKLLAASSEQQITIQALRNENLALREHVKKESENIKATFGSTISNLKTGGEAKSKQIERRLEKIEADLAPISTYVDELKSHPAVWDEIDSLLEGLKQLKGSFEDRKESWPSRADFLQEMEDDKKEHSTLIENLGKRVVDAEKLVQGFAAEVTQRLDDELKVIKDDLDVRRLSAGKTNERINQLEQHQNQPLIQSSPDIETSITAIRQEITDCKIGHNKLEQIQTQLSDCMRFIEDLVISLPGVEDMPRSPQLAVTLSNFVQEFNSLSTAVRVNEASVNTLKEWYHGLEDRVQQMRDELSKYEEGNTAPTHSEEDATLSTSLEGMPTTSTGEKTPGKRGRPFASAKGSSGGPSKKRATRYGK